MNDVLKIAGMHNNNCDKEDVSDDEQQLHIEEAIEVIKCRWCPRWSRSQAVKVINEHVKKSKMHLMSRIRELELPQPKEPGVQMHLSDFYRSKAID